LSLALLTSCLLHVFAIALSGAGTAGSSQTAGNTSTPTRPGQLTVSLNYPDQSSPLSPSSPSLLKKVEEATADIGAAVESAAPSPADTLLPVPPPEIVFYPADQLTVRPVALGKAALEPPEIDQIRAAGTIVLVLRINTRGAVIDANIESSDLPELFSEVAQKAFRNLRFRPGELDGVKVRTLMRVEVRYDSAGRLIR
jgi:hypothetical protein